MLSLESIEQRLDNPKAYFMFYEFFYKAAVGECRWKECMGDGTSRIGNDTTEAFALLLFSNNYKAWLYEEKDQHGTKLLTEYESEAGESIVDRWLLNQEFNLGETTGGDVLLDDPTTLSYKVAVKTRKDWRVKLKKMEVCEEMKKTWLEVPVIEGNENEPNDGDVSFKKGGKVRKGNGGRV